MTYKNPSTRRWLHVAENILGHAAAMAAGFVLMVIGLGLGVTMIMLPAGIVIGLLGVALFTGGLLTSWKDDASA